MKSSPEKGRRKGNSPHGTFLRRRNRVKKGYFLKWPWFTARAQGEKNERTSGWKSPIGVQEKKRGKPVLLQWEEGKMDRTYTDIRMAHAKKKTQRSPAPGHKEKKEEPKEGLALTRLPVSEVTLSATIELFKGVPKKGNHLDPGRKNNHQPCREKAVENFFEEDRRPEGVGSASTLSIGRGG